ncbi:MAG: hypothetical protein JXK95_16920 [Bacteroidales bacterium]|nr:hypothetical protein [Bacteroidales bacterium]
MNSNPINQNVLRFGYYSSLLLAIITFITFGLGIMAVPPVGPYCPGDCFEYPYLDSLSNYPKDYYWMFFSVFQLIIYVVFMVSVYFIAPAEKKINSFTGFAFALIATAVLMADYFVQFAVVPISLMKGEEDGIALLTQYNENGLFIALEELGYIMMALSLLFIAPVFSKHPALDRTLRWILYIPMPLIILFFIFYTVRYGIERSYRFEVAAIGIDWLALIIIGILAAIFFKRKLKKTI